MTPGSTVWWIYYVVFLLTCLLLLLGTKALVRRVPRAETWVRVAAVLLILWPAHLTAREACRVTGVSQDSHMIRVLQRVEPGEAPVPDPPPVRYSPISPIGTRALLYVGLPLIMALFVGCAVMGRREPRGFQFMAGVLGTLFWIAVGVICWRERDHGDPDVDRSGPRDVWKGRAVPWASIEGGHVLEVRGVGGDIESEQLRLEDANGRRVWAARIEKLPPDVRANLFAWVRARAGLREDA